MATVWLALFLCLLGSTQASECKNSLINTKEILKSLLQDADAMRQLEEAYYPVNEHSSLIVEVNFTLVPLEDDDTDFREEQTEPGVLGDITEASRIAEHKIVKRQSPRETTERNHSSIIFRWINSPTYLSINPDLLHQLSLWTYTASSNVPQVQLNVSLPCTGNELQQFLPTSKDGCPNGHHDLALSAFNNVTSESSVLEDGIPQNKEKGYALFYYDTKKRSGYCILDKEGQYEKQRIYLGITIGFLLAFIALCIPLIFYMMFNKFHEIMKQPEDDEKENNWRYFIWGTVATCSLLSVLIIAYDIYVFQNNLHYYPKHHYGEEDRYMYEIYVLFCVVISLMIFCFVVDIALIILSLVVIKKVNVGDDFIKDIEIPLLLKSILEKLPCCCCFTRNRDTGGANDGQDNRRQYCNYCDRICAQSAALFLGNLVITIFLQIFGFHVFFIGLGVLATPVHSLSMICFFVAFFILSIAFMAMLLKITNTDRHSICIFSTVLGLLGLGFLISLILYYYTYFLAVEDYNYDSAVLTILGHILPVAITALLAFCAKKMVQYVKEGGFAAARAQPVIPPAHEDT